MRCGSREIIATRFRECEKRRGHLRADEVPPDVLRPGFAAAIAKKAGHRIGGAFFERSAENIARGTETDHGRDSSEREGLNRVIVETEFLARRRRRQPL